MDNQTMAANAGATEQQSTQSVPTANTAPEGSAAAANTTEDVTQTQAFSRRLKEMSGRAVDDFVASLGQTNPYTNKPIRTAQEMRDYHVMREADELGQDPETAAHIRSVEEELAQYRYREAQASLREDPEIGQFYDQFKDEVEELISFGRQQGKDITPDAALRTIIAGNLGTIMHQTANSAAAATLAGIDANRAASPGSIGGGSVDIAPSYATMSDADFAKQVAAAKRGELKHK